MERKELKLGVAYHGNRMPHHAKEDISDMVRNGMNIVVHMFSHTDWERHRTVMKDIVFMSQEAGLEVWVDNWGLGGPPGDKSHFLAYYPDSHMYFSNGEMVPAYACLSSPDYRKFVKEWIDTVAELGAKTIFWDEPHMPEKRVGDIKYYGCACPRCRKRFEEKYGRPMPVFADKDTDEFEIDSVVEYFSDITEYSASKGMTNAVCVMLGTYGMSLDAADRICALPNVDNIGSDPYWISKKKKQPELDVYDFVRRESKRNIELCDRFEKDHNIWIQTYSNPRGAEEDIILATEAAYDAGARTILAWGYYGSESNDYRAKNPELTWAMTCEAMKRVRNFERDAVLAEKRKNHIT